VSKEEGSGILLPVVRAWDYYRLGNRALKVFKGVVEICKHGRLVFELVLKLIKVGKKVSKNVSIL
jgi:hypothetical protein